MLLLYGNKTKRKQKMTKAKNILKWIGGSLGVATILGFFGMVGYILLDSEINPKKYQKVREMQAKKDLRGTDYIIINPTKTKITYINSDSLPDLVYNSQEIYLQTKEGKFISYKDVLKQEKSKLDSIYQVKQDSLKKVFENKLEKDVK